MVLINTRNMPALVASLQKKNGLTGSVNNNTIELGRDGTSLFIEDATTIEGPITGISTLNMSGVSTFNNDVRLTNLYSLLDANDINDSGNDYTVNIVANKINIGNNFSEVKINGTTTYVFTDELVTQDPLISLNFSQGTNLGSSSSGFETYSNNSVVGYLKTTPTQDKYWIKASNTTTMFVATTDLDNNFTAAARLNVSGVTTINSASTLLSTLNVSGVTTINDTLNAMEVKQQYQASPIAFALLVPPGCIMQYIAISAPNGWLVCNGSAVSRTTYANLFAVIGTTFGSGNGSTTFTLPDFRGRVPVGYGTGTGLTARSMAVSDGAETHTLSVNEMPSHNHTATDSGHTHTGTTNADGVHNHEYICAKDDGNSSNNPGQHPAGDASVGSDNNSTYTENAGSHTHTFTTASGTASITVGNSGSGNAHNNMQPFLVVNYIIKY